MDAFASMLYERAIGQRATGKKAADEHHYEHRLHARRSAPFHGPSRYGPDPSALSR
jgi:hypothetical protein